MRRLTRAIARVTQSDERTLRLALFAAMVSIVAAVLIEKVLV
jgi:hypothetical protein